MKALEDKILSQGKVLPGNVLNVSSFLNHMIDADFSMQMGAEIKRLFAGEKIDKILTIEASGIALAVATAAALHVPMLFAKKSKTSNLSGEFYQAKIHSYTHSNDYTAIVNRNYISKGERILIVDDFLANGEAVRGLIKIVSDAGAVLAGAAVAVEKGFQPGGRMLREQGIHLESLAVIESMTDSSVTFRKQ